MAEEIPQKQTEKPEISISIQSSESRLVTSSEESEVHQKTQNEDSTKEDGTSTPVPLKPIVEQPVRTGRATGISPRQVGRRAPPPMMPLRDTSPDPPPSTEKQDTAFTSTGRPPGLPTPKQPSKCPLFCCFYAEFDNKVGPKIRYQTPRNFMDQDIQMHPSKIHKILQETFDHLKASPPTFSAAKTNETKTTETSAASPLTFSVSKTNETKTTETSAAVDVAATQAPPNYSTNNTDSVPATTTSTTTDQLSIFDSCSEYIITGSALSGKLVNLSTHHLHILTRPTVILDNERYERNALLFCVGFVLRRSEDPRPFRPVLSRLADALRDLEVEHQVLSSPSSPSTDTDALLQSILEWTLLSLNSSLWECNAQLNAANILNLKLFHPPKPPALPVADYQVPVFLRRDWQVQSYDWDLAINWVSLHIDGVINARQISKRADVDIEMVHACLRVLRHHGVIALVDMFFFTNKYECTEKAAGLLTGKEMKLLNDAADFVLRRPHQQDGPGGSVGEPTGQPLSSSPIGASARFLLEPLHQQQVAASHHESLGSFRVGVSPPQLHDAQTTARRAGVEYHDIKIALSELYNVCHRGISIGDLWLSLISGELPTALSATLNWRKMFTLIDIRRFTSFGQVHGLIRRVHDYPLLLNDNTSVPEKSEWKIYSRSLFDPVSSQGPLSWDKTRLQSRTESLTKQVEFRRRVSQCLDGRHCDDELVCLFERSYEDLLELFQGSDILHVFATQSA